MGSSLPLLHSGFPRMGGKWNVFGFELYKVLWAVLVFHMQAQECVSVNVEGWALLKFRMSVEVDPYGAFKNWDPQDRDPCNWSGVCCIDGKVEILNLEGLSLRGTLSPELGKLSYLKSLVLLKNNFFGPIPKEVAGLTMLELLDLRCNNFSGIIPVEIGDMLSLRRLLLCGNNFQGTIPSIERLNMHFEQRCNQDTSFNSSSEISSINRKVGRRIWQGGLQQLKMIDFAISIKPKIFHFLDMHLFKFKKESSLYAHKETNDANMTSFIKPTAVQYIHTDYSFRRKLIQETTNLPALPVSAAIPQEEVDIPSIASGSFPAVPSSASVNSGSTEPFLETLATPPQNHPPSKPTNMMEGGFLKSERVGKWLFAFVLPGIAFLAIVASMLACRRQEATNIRPWKTGLSGPLQKALVAGVPELNRSELEAACEDFSNIISTHPLCTLFKGTLSSGVEIAVVSTCISSAKDWSRHSEACFRKKIDTLSRVNHKNFVNLLGYCEENEPFTRMMVFEYAPSGTLFDHLHSEEFEHLDWCARIRIIMGMAYCLQYMHHDLNPPVTISYLKSNIIFLSDDYAAKIADVSVWKEVAKRKISGENDMDHSGSPYVDPEGNVHDFGVLMLEIITGKLPYSEEEGSLLNWATQYLTDKRKINKLVDPMLKSFKDEELDIVVEVIQDCIRQDPAKRPTMKEVTAQLQEVIPISPEAATPRLSPLWWAELEILSGEAS